MTEKLQPLPRPTSLAATPKSKPKFSTTIQLASGEPLPAADPRATRALIALMDMGAVLGGAASHWGGPSAFAELMSALHAYMFDQSARTGRPWFDLFSFVNDGGHCENGIYALRALYGFAGLDFEQLKKFRSIESRLTGHGESHLFPEGVLLSNGPLGSAFPQSQGLAYADAITGKERVTVTAITDGGCMEGEAREAMAAIPGLAAAGKLAPYVLIISDNNTKLTGRIDEESFSMAPTFEAMRTLGWEVFDLYEAHDLQACYDGIESAIQAARENPRKPVAIHARTVKGVGVKKTADSASGGHGFPLKAPSELAAFLQEIYGGDSVPEEFTKWAKDLEAQAEAKKAKASTSSGPATTKVQAGVSAALIKKRKEGLPIVSISADLPGSTGMAEFQKAYPECTQDVGVAESNMVSMAAGASKMGLIPVVDTFSQFGVTKGALPLTMASLSGAPVIGIFSHAGFQDAADGASHQALTYLSKTCSIPHTQVHVLSCRDEAEALVGQAVDLFAAQMKAGKSPDSQIFFLGRENFPASYGAKDYQLGRAQVLRNGSSPQVVIAAAGPMVGQALAAAEELAAAGVETIVINPSSIAQIDVKSFIPHLEKCGGRLVTVEDHQLIGGMGAMLSHALLQEGVALRVRSLGVRGEFGQSAYNAIELYKKHGMDATAIAAAVRELVNTRGSGR
ncbi:MAG: transketolase C-terminal domain-containing protein [Bdellovibrionales bacterium]